MNFLFDLDTFAEQVEVRQLDRCVLEDFTQCSKCHLWKLMMSFYDRKGPESWSSGVVPHFITCNTFIAKSYAKVYFICQNLFLLSPKLFRSRFFKDLSVIVIIPTAN
jgi:hypothetical protein